MQNMIKQARQSRGILAQKLADIIGTSRGQILQLETGKRRLSTDWIDRIKKALNCTTAELLGEEDIQRTHSGNSSNLTKSSTHSDKKRDSPQNTLYDNQLKKQAVERIGEYLKNRPIKISYSGAEVITWWVYRLLKKGGEVGDALLDTYFDDVLGKDED